jgi:hypothetical protein
MQARFHSTTTYDSCSVTHSLTSTVECVSAPWFGLKIGFFLLLPSLSSVVPRHLFIIVRVWDVVLKIESTVTCTHVQAFFSSSDI